ncbi:MAG TPA: hypothetical protein VFP84_36650, partial [Kofleriaceae bacterium]|nr:hypothetical protein [Kofleriaceae bacterium]
MQPRLILFTDADDNTMLVRFADGRVQLSAVDSRPTLEGYELNRFLAELFQTYAAAPLVARAAEAEAALERARAQLPAGRSAKARAARAAL